MRLEQLVLFGPGDDERVHFGPRLTVMAGLTLAERTALVSTVVDALTGRLPNASVVYSDHTGERVFADRTGATYATTGEPADGPAQVLGTDPAVVARLLTLTADDLGLGPRTSVEDLEGELSAARQTVTLLQADHTMAAESARIVEERRAELADLTEQIVRSDDDAARWAWLELRRRLDQVRAELAMLDRSNDGRADRLLLDAVGNLRAAGQAWADVKAEATAQRSMLGTLPELTLDDLAKVAATPDALPEAFEDHLGAWRDALDGRTAAEAHLAHVTQDPPEMVEDALVDAFAALDQDLLWAAHAGMATASATYDRVAASLEERDDLSEEVEELIEAAHLEVVRCQRKVDLLFRPGILGAAVFAVGGLLAGRSIHLVVGVPMLAAAVAMVWWLIMWPQRQLDQAAFAEKEALVLADADSWLGLHLRRLDAVTDAKDRDRFEEAANERAAAMVDWEEIAGELSPADLTARADAVRLRADEIDPTAMAARREEARARVVEAVAHEATTRAAISFGLEGYGLSATGAADLDADQLPAVLGRRIEAGRTARKAREVLVIEHREREAGEQLDQILRQLGFVDGSIPSRLERALRAVAAAQHREDLASTARTAGEIRAEVDQLEGELAFTYRARWDGTPHPVEPPPNPDVLDQRRRELSALVAEGGKPDVVGAERRLDMAIVKVREVETQIRELANGPGSLHQRLISKVGRATWLGEHEDTVPILVNEALLTVPIGERMELLDLLVRLSARTQVIVLTNDPVVAGWARDRVQSQPVVLYEAQGPVPEAEVDGLTATASSRALIVDGPVPTVRR